MNNRGAVGAGRLFHVLLAFVLVPPSAFAENTVSRPAGFVRLVVQSNASILVSIPFDAFDPSLGEVLKGQLTGGPSADEADRILKWDAGKQEYLCAFRAEDTGDPDRDGEWFSDDVHWTACSLTIHPGEAFWIENRQGQAQSVYLAGHVILDETKSLPLGSALNLFSYPFSSKIALNETELAEDGGRSHRPVWAGRGRRLRPAWRAAVPRGRLRAVVAAALRAASWGGSVAALLL